MQLKVCGMCEMSNIRELAAIRPDWMGLIFYLRSPRYPHGLTPGELQRIPIPKVGVFVDESTEKIMQTAEEWGLDAVQMHGDESWQVVRDLSQAGLTTIKVFRIADRLPGNLGDFAPYSTYFLFDTLKSSAYGGTGVQFDWSVLAGYQGAVPYLLSGGIGPDDIDRIIQAELPGCAGIDINSRVEVRPGLKDIQLIKKIKEKI